MNQIQTEKIVGFLTELVEFRKREVNDMLKVGYARLSIPKYQERTTELLSLLSTFKTSDNENRILTDAIDNSHLRQNKALLNEEKQCDELQALKEKYAYLVADFDNYKKRTIKNEKYANDKAYETIVSSFLRTYDDMERLYNALELSEEVEESVSKLDAAFVMIFENFEKTLASFGFEKIDCCRGDKFDVYTMEAISARFTRPDEHLNVDDVAEIYQSGWMHNGKLIRPVKVVVAK